jgi:hypothetical protein
MSEGRTAVGTAQRVGTGIGRVVRAWRALPHERRLAAIAAIGLFLTLFLPWYQETVIAQGKATNLQSASATLTGWGAFSFVEAAVLLVAIGVLTLLFQRAEGRAFHLPGGDGWVIMAAGVWTCVLVIWRIFDKQGTSSHGQFATTSGIEWGIFIALAVAAFLAYAGSRIRAAHRPEPPLPGEDDAAGSAPPSSAPPRRGDRRVRPPRPVRAEDPRGRRRRDEPGGRSPEPIAGDDPEGRDSEPFGEDDPPTRRTQPLSEDDPPTRRRRPLSDDARTSPFERVEPDDPPTMRFGPSTPAASARHAARPDEQLTIPLKDDDAEN